MQPINYMLDVQNPVQMALQGYAQGQGLKAQQQGMEAQKQALDMQRQQYEQAQAQIAQQQARAQEVQGMMGQFAEMVRTGNVTAEDVIQMQFMVPEMAESIKGAYDMLSTSQRDGKINDLSRIAIALKRNPEIAIEMLDERLLAAENSGDMEQVNLMKAIKAQAEMEPSAVLSSVLMELATVMPKDQFGNFMAVATPQANETEAFRTLSQRAAAAGLVPGTPEFAEFMIQGGPERTPLVQITNGQETAFAAEAGKQEATNFGAIVTAGQTAGRNRQVLNQLDVALANTPGGIEAALKAQLGGFGIETEGLSDIQAAEALISQLVPAQRPPGSGPMSDRDLELFKKSLPRLIQTTEGRRKIIANIKGVNDYFISEGEIAARVLGGEITPAEGRKQMSALINPLAETPVVDERPKSAGGLPVVRTDEDYDALPSGAEFIGEDGKPYRKR